MSTNLLISYSYQQVELGFPFFKPTIQLRSYRSLSFCIIYIKQPKQLQTVPSRKLTSLQ